MFQALFRSHSNLRAQAIVTGIHRGADEGREPGIRQRLPADDNEHALFLRVLRARLAHQVKLARRKRTRPLGPRSGRDCSAHRCTCSISGAGPGIRPTRPRSRPGGARCKDRGLLNLPCAPWKYLAPKKSRPVSNSGNRFSRSVGNCSIATHRYGVLM
jgi:hypothetical protein